MRRSSTIVALGVLALSTPAPAAAAAFGGTGDWEQLAFGVATLAAAIALLVIAMGLARVAEGSAMAENIRWVVLAAVCIAAHVLVGWVARFLPDDFSTAVARTGSDAFIILGLVFLCVYFWRVRAALARFLKVATSEDELLAESHMSLDDAPGDPEPTQAEAPSDTDPQG